MATLKQFDVIHDQHHGYGYILKIEGIGKNGIALICWPANRTMFYSSREMNYTLTKKYIEKYYTIVSKFNSKEESIAYITALRRLL